jgi:hypothetical protein
MTRSMPRAVATLGMIILLQKGRSGDKLYRLIVTQSVLLQVPTQVSTQLWLERPSDSNSWVRANQESRIPFEWLSSGDGLTCRRVSTTQAKSNIALNAAMI